MVLRLKTTALPRIELACEPMNQTAVSLGFPVLREVRLLKSGRQCIVMFFCAAVNTVLYLHIWKRGEEK